MLQGAKLVGQVITPDLGTGQEPTAAPASPFMCDDWQSRIADRKFFCSPPQNPPLIFAYLNRGGSQIRTDL